LEIQTENEAAIVFKWRGGTHLDVTKSDLVIAARRARLPVRLVLPGAVQVADQGDFGAVVQQFLVGHFELAEPRPLKVLEDCWSSSWTYRDGIRT
jgi:hypothetical protein